MKVKELIKELQKANQEADVFITVRQCKNCMYIKGIYENEEVTIEADWQDFELDEEVMEEIEREKAEDNEQAQIDRAIKNYKAI